MRSEAREQIRRYVTNAITYLGNGLESLQKDEVGKASELLWGSVAEAIQAVAASRNMRLANHRSLRYFASQLAKELGDRSINDGFVIAERLHSNFHEVDLEAQDVAAVVDPIRETVSKLLKLIPEELLAT